MRRAAPLVFAMSMVMLRSAEVMADSFTPFDQRACVCDAIDTAPRDIVTARFVMTDAGGTFEVVSVVTHGNPPRQVPDQLVVGMERYHGAMETSGPFLLYEQGERDAFCGIRISSFDMEAVSLRILICGVSPENQYTRGCTTDFKLSQLQPFMQALAQREDTCPALATKYLGIPKPPPEGADNFPQYLCGGGAAPGSFVLILGALGFVAFWGHRRRWKT